MKWKTNLSSNFRYFIFLTFQFLNYMKYIIKIRNIYLWLILFDKNYFPKIIFLEAPKFCPAWVAPLFCPAWSPMIASPALNCCSVNSLLFSSAGLGPKYGPLHSGCLYAVRPMAKMVVVTRTMFLPSHRSGGWKMSVSATPYWAQALWNLK